jgi:hypothetical protein
MKRATRFTLCGLAAVIIAAAGAWLAREGLLRAPATVDPAIKTWRGGETNACMVAVDGAALQEFAARYAVAMLCGIERTDADPLTDRAITVSRSFPIQSAEFPIEEAISGPMRVLLAERAAQARGSAPWTPDALHEETIWYELVLLPREIDAFQVRTLGDVRRVGGRRLLSRPRQTVLAIRP